MRYDGRLKGSQHSPKSWGAHHGSLLFASKTDSAKVRPFRLITDDEMMQRFPKVDDKGRRYTTIAHFRGVNMGDRPNLCYEWRGFRNPNPSGWRVSKERLKQEYQDGGVVIRPNGTLERRRFYNPSVGVKVGNVWTDIPSPPPTELIGFPTQKPLELLERIIRASSNEGDMVLDPFCGCATACVAADTLNRQWVGIDISEKAVEFVNMRLQQTMGSLFHNRYVTSRTDVPRRTDIDTPKNYRQSKHVLFGRQEGLCGGCKVMFPFRNFTVDHIVPQSRGGTDHLENLQLLCGACNSMKGDRDQAYLGARLKETAVA